MSSGQIWTSIRVQEQITRMEAGLDVDTSCFHEGDKYLRKAEISFQYTKEEQKEIVKCANDVLYFASKYCFAMTDAGITKIDLRDYQRDMLRDFQDNRFVVMMASRQIGKCALYTSKINIADTQRNEYFTISIGNLYYLNRKLQNKLKFTDRIKYVLWNLYDLLDSNKK